MTDQRTVQKKIILLACLILIVVPGFCACGKKAKETASTDHAYQMESLKVDGIPDEVNVVRECSGVVWLAGIRDGKPCLGNFTVSKPDYQESVLALPEKEQLVDFYIDSEETVTMITSETKTEEKQYLETLRLYQCSKEGKEPRMLSELKDCESNYKLCMTEAWIYLVEEGYRISVFDREGKQHAASESKNQRNQIQAVCENGQECYYVSPETDSPDIVVGTIKQDGTAEEKGKTTIQMKEEVDIFPSKDKTGELYYKDRAGIYKINSEQSSDKVLSWDSFNILGFRLSSVLSLENEAFLCWNSGEHCFVRITKGKKQSTEEQGDAVEEIVFASYGIDDDDRNRVFRFNEEHDDCKIVIRDYSESDNGDEQFHLDVASGDIPDILKFNSIDPIMLAEKGMFTDLSVLMEQDPEVSKEDLLDPVVKLLEMDGGIYFLPVNFTIEALVGDKGDIGDRDRWTLGEFEAFCKERKEEGAKEIICWTNREGFASWGAQLTMEDYINLNNGTVNFLTEEFQKLLSISKEYFPEKVDLYTAQARKIKDGTASLISTDLCSFSQCVKYQWMFKENGYSFIGYPSKDASHFGIGMQIREYYGIAQKCSRKKEAWEFLRQYFLKDYYLEPNADPPGFSIRKDIMEYEKELAIAKKEYTNDKGEKIRPWLKGRWINVGDSTDEIYVKSKPLKKEQIEQIEELINHMDILSMSTSIYFRASGIIANEVQAGFGDNKSIEEIMDIIQSRVSIMVSEQS